MMIIMLMVTMNIKQGTVKDVNILQKIYIIIIEQKIVQVVL